MALPPRPARPVGAEPVAETDGSLDPELASYEAVSDAAASDAAASDAAARTAPAPVPAPVAVPVSPDQSRALSEVKAQSYVTAGKINSSALLDVGPDHWKALDPDIVKVTTWVQDRLKEQNLAEKIELARIDDETNREVTQLIDREVLKYVSKVSMLRGEPRAYLIQAVINEMIGLGPIEPLRQDPRITEIMINGPHEVYVEIEGKTRLAPGARFRDQQHLLQVCQQILKPLNRTIDIRNPLEDGRLGDGSRVNVVHYEVAPEGPVLTIRRFPKTVWTMEKLIEVGSVDEGMACLLAWLIANKASTLVAGGTGSGKALDVDTRIPGPDGWTRMGDLHVGSPVFDEAGQPCLVTAVFDQPDGRDCYEVGFCDGTSVVADADHNWLTTTGAGPGPQVVTTARIAETLRTADGEAAHSVALSAPVRYPRRELPASPYQAGLRARRVPDIYLIASQEQRRDLLAGLLDAAGWHAGGPAVVFASPDETLAGQVLSLAASLGYRAVADKDAARTDGVETGTVHRVVFDAADDVFRLSDHAARHAADRTGHLTAARRIVSVRPVPTRPVRCITVDSASSLFLCGDQYVPTHNTSLLNALSSCIPRDERIITIEDALELRLHPDAHVVAMGSRPDSASGTGAVTIRMCVKNALRMKPDRIVVGECRGPEALDMLQAMNTGHDGSLTTVHANNAESAMQRLAVLVAQGGEIPDGQVNWLIAEALDLIVFQRKFRDGTRRVESIHEIPTVDGLEAGARITTSPLWVWKKTGQDPMTGRLVGEYEKVNDISEGLYEKLQLEYSAPFTMDDIRRMSQVPATQEGF